MPQEFQTSFIPKKVDASPARSRGGVSVPTFVGILALVISILAALGVFGYQRLLTRSIERKQGQLEAARAAFDPELIRELERLGARLTISREILGTHRAPSGLFDLVEDVTLQSVQFTSFELSVSPEGGILLSMGGEAPDFASVALQSDEFGSDPRIKSPIFSDLAVSDRGTVTFLFSGTIDADVLAYEDRAPADTLLEEDFPEDEVPPNESATGTEETL